MLKIGVLIPTRGDRPQLLKFAMKQLERQTLQPDEILIVDYPPVGLQPDIRDRYAKGYAQLEKLGCDLVFFWEDDDWYATNYLERMMSQYISFGSPPIFGINSTIYYHLKKKTWMKMQHVSRASMMSTIMRTGLNPRWEKYHEKFCDIDLWREFKGLSVPFETICLGIKHGTGICGGIGHNSQWKGYNHDDPDGIFLNTIVGDEDYKFYQSLWKKN